MLDPETIHKIIDWIPILSMGRNGTARRPVLTRLAEQLLFSGVIAMGVIWLNQHDDHILMEQLKESISSLNQRLDRLERRLEARDPLADEDRISRLRRSR